MNVASVPRQWRRRFASVLLAIATTAVVVVPGPSATAETTRPYDELQLLHGVFFGWGPVAAEQPLLALPETPVPDTAPNQLKVTSMVEMLTTRYPGLIEDFQTAAYSGDPELIVSTTGSLSRRLVIVAYAPAQAPDNTGSDCELVLLLNGKPHAVPVADARLRSWVVHMVAILGPSAG